LRLPRLVAPLRLTLMRRRSSRRSMDAIFMCANPCTANRRGGTS
jgi:hypothetical protein